MVWFSLFNGETANVRRHRIRFLLDFSDDMPYFYGRINDQFRVCFVWTDDGPERVEITDYH